MITRFCTLLAALAFGLGARADGPSFAPLGKLASELGSGLAPFLAGAEPAASWPTFVATAQPAEALATWRTAMQGATGGTPYALELSLAWDKDGEVVYQVDVEVFVGAEGPSLLSLVGKSPARAVAAGFRPTRLVAGAERPIGEAGELIAQALATGGVLPYAATESLAKLTAGDALAKARAALEKAPRTATNVKTILVAREPDGVRLRVGALRFATMEGDTPRGFLTATLALAGGKLGLELAAYTPFDGAPAAGAAGESWYPTDTKPPAGTQYPCAFTALPKAMTGIAEGDRLYVDHAYAMVVKAIHAKLVVLNALGQPKGPYDAAERTYRATVEGALGRIKAETVPAGLESFHADLGDALALQLSFFKDAAVARKAGKDWNEMMAIPSGRAASAKLFAAWGQMERRYPKWSPEVKDSLYHHLCALDLF